MFKTAYETLAARNYDADRIRSEVQRDVLGGDAPFFLDRPMSHSRRDESSVKTVLGVHPDNDQVPSFSHPIDIEIGDRSSSSTFICIDSRPYMKASGVANYQYTNIGEYAVQHLRAMLNYHWIVEDPEDLFNLGELGPLVFMRWLTNAISKRLGLDPADQVKVTIITYFYWYSLFQEKAELDEKTKQKLVGKLSRITSIPAGTAFELVDNVDGMSGIEDYCNCLRENIPNKRLEKINPGFIFAILGGSWFGNNVREVIAVATEHPPTFIALVVSAAQSRSWKKTTIGTLVEDLDRKGRGEEYIKAVGRLIERQTH